MLKLHTIPTVVVLGSAVLVHPIVDMGSVGTTVYFPGSNEVITKQAVDSQR